MSLGIRWFTLPQFLCFISLVSCSPTDPTNKSASKARTELLEELVSSSGVSTDVDAGAMKAKESFEKYVDQQISALPESRPGDEAARTALIEEYRYHQENLARSINGVSKLDLDQLPVNELSDKDLFDVVAFYKSDAGIKWRKVMPAVVAAAEKSANSAIEGIAAKSFKNTSDLTAKASKIELHRLVEVRK